MVVGGNLTNVWVPSSGGCILSDLDMGEEMVRLDTNFRGTNKQDLNQNHSEEANSPDNVFPECHQ